MTIERLTPISKALVITISLAALTTIVLWVRQSTPEETVDPREPRFIQAVDAGRTREALELGEALLTALREREPNNPDLIALTDRLETARQISALIANHIRSSGTLLAEGLEGMDELELPLATGQGGAGAAAFLPPAQEVYWTHLRTFTAASHPEDLSNSPRQFWDRYGDLRMRESVMEIGRQIVLTDPDFSENACYAIVLPLLHLHGRDDAWSQMESVLGLFPPETLNVLSEFALLQTERPRAAMAIARYGARATGERFSPVRWTLEAADSCSAIHRPDLLDKLLAEVLTEVANPDTIARLGLKSADSYARCGDYAEAARSCGRILADLPETSLYGRVVATHLGYLAKEEMAGQVIANSESVLDDPRCRPYLAQILYLRWWALQKTNRPGEATRVAQRLIDQHGGSACLAPVLLARATDALASQEYSECRELLTRLIEDFPGTESTKRAQDILTRLKNGRIE